MHKMIIIVILVMKKYVILRKLYISFLKIGGLTAQRQGFGEATNPAAFFADTGFDGILGLGYASLAVGGIPPVFDTLGKQQQLRKRVFAFHLRR